MSALTEAAAELAVDIEATGAPFVITPDEDGNRLVFSVNLTGEERTLGYIDFPGVDETDYLVYAEGSEPEDAIEVGSYTEAAGILAITVLLALTIGA